MRDIEPAREEARFCHLTCRLKTADHYLIALFAMVSRLRNEDVEEDTVRTISMLLYEAHENIADAQKLKDELMALHAPDQIIPPREPNEPASTVTQWQERMGRGQLPFQACFPIPK